MSHREMKYQKIANVAKAVIMALNISCAFAHLLRTRICAITRAASAPRANINISLAAWRGASQQHRRVAAAANK
jgi:hypothetical protein